MGKVGLLRVGEVEPESPRDVLEAQTGCVPEGRPSLLQGLADRRAFPLLVPPELPHGLPVVDRTAHRLPQDRDDAAVAVGTCRVRTERTIARDPDRTHFPKA